ncbi:unnamed protein product [Callosobruchus maculatus]|uniref:C2H2-type domain-containing protein n=1 Tax=Callosobruchus maculatus TaxID=64391 RepID=A0A653CDE6_CALMS|nr:unnamed protein product [Callosobruchus maculatus]
MYSIFFSLNWWSAEVNEIDGHMISDRIEEVNDIGIIEQTLYPEENIQGNVFMFLGNIQHVLGSSTIDIKMKHNFSTNNPKQHMISRTAAIEVLRATLDINFKHISSNNTFDNMIQKSNEIADILHNTDSLTNLTSLKTTNNIEDQSVLFADKTIHSSDTSINAFDCPIKQEKDYDVFDPDTTVEALSMLDELTSAVDIKIEECVSDWNDKNTYSRYLGEDEVTSAIQPDICIVKEEWLNTTESFNPVECQYCMEKFETSESKVKHECVCHLAPRLVVDMVKQNSFLEKEIKKDCEVALPSTALCKYCNEGFETSELELKHECVCSSARHLVIELRPEDADIRPKRQKANAVNRELASCWSGVDQVWKVEKENTADIGESLRVQKKRVTDKKLLSCTRCPYKTTYKSHMARHILTPHSKRLRIQETDETKPLRCNYCSFKSKYKNSIRRHIIRRHKDVRTEKIKKDYLLACVHCSFKTESGADLDRHNSEHHKPSLSSDRTKRKEERRFACIYCNFKSKFQPCVRRHIYVKHENRVFICYHCGYKLNDKITLKKHLLKFRENKTYRCIQCSFEAYCRIALRMHVKKKHNTCRAKEKEDGKFTCIYCDYKSEYPSCVRQHFRLKHENRVFICYHCGYKFNDKNTLTSHLLKYTENTHKCSKCSFQAYCRNALRMHMKRKHKTKKKICCSKRSKCPHCSLTFSCKATVGDHILQKHREFSDSVTQKISSCYNCTFQTTSKGHLRDHMLKHFNFQPYQCERCKFKTKSRPGLKRHILMSQCKKQ